MIIVKVMGGLGNQMFQYAFARNLEKENGHTVALDLSYYDNQAVTDTVRKEVISTFPHKFKKASPEQIICLQNRNRKIWNRIFGKMGLYRSNMISEEEEWDQQREFMRDQIYVTGYWQSEKYFRNISDSIKKELDFSKRQIDHKSEELLRRINESGISVAVHVRAGDYLKKENAECFGNICTERYYRRACEYMLTRNPKCRFFVFTNDTEWVSENIHFPFENMEIVENGANKEEWTDLFLMSQCNHNIIANSSYSWWSAWLNPHQDKLVISPDRWTNFNINKNTICDEWIRINGE